MSSVRILPAGAREEVTGVLCDAFADYPVMRFVLGEAHRDRDRLFRLIGFFVAARVLRDDLLLGISTDGHLAAVALVTLPANGPAPDALDEERERVWADLGTDARARYDAFSRACAPFAVAAPHLHLNMIGVRRRHQGRGLARRLLERVEQISRGRPDSAGVTLSTEDPRNLPLYEHFGYRITGHARVAPELESWGFFRAH